MAQALPPNQYPPGPWHDAYKRCLDFETHAPDFPPPRSGPTRLVSARLLGYMMLEAPGDKGRDTMSREIISATSDAAIDSLAKHFLYHFVRCFKSAKGRTPAPSNHPTRPSFDNVQDMLKYLLERSPQNHQTAKLKAFIRDNNRCVLCRKYDTNLYLNNVAAVLEAVDNGGAAITYTTAAHIFPESTNDSIEEGSPKLEYAATVWAVMERFGNVLITEELNGPDIHNLTNVITMATDYHTSFDNLQLWFEPTATLDQYVIHATRPALLLGIQMPIIFEPRPDYPAPDPRYLRLHAACARVAHLSGAGEYILAVLRDMETTVVLAKDGSSSDLLHHALLRTDIQVS